MAATMPPMPGTSSGVRRSWVRRPTTTAAPPLYVGCMNPNRRPAKAPPQADARSRRPPAGEGTNAVRHRPDPKAEPIPDGEHKYVPRSPYRTGNY